MAIVKNANANLAKSIVELVTVMGKYGKVQMITDDNEIIICATTEKTNDDNPEGLFQGSIESEDVQRLNMETDNRLSFQYEENYYFPNMIENAEDGCTVFRLSSTM